MRLYPLVKLVYVVEVGESVFSVVIVVSSEDVQFLRHREFPLSILIDITGKCDRQSKKFLHVCKQAVCCKGGL